MTPSKAQEAFNSYYTLIQSALDIETIYEIRLQLAYDERLTYNQRDALRTVAMSRVLIMELDTGESENRSYMPSVGKEKQR